LIASIRIKCHPASLRVFDEDIEIAVLIEDTSVDELEL
jgi:hypothetical protein